MIERIVIENFKSLRKVDLSLGHMNLLIGTNASGKSNFLEALRVLEGIGNGFTISEILNGKPRTSTSDAWEGIRGGSAHACFARADGEEEVTITTYGTFGTPPSLNWKYDIVFSPQDEGKVVREYINMGKSEYSSEDWHEQLNRIPHKKSNQIHGLSEMTRRPVLGSYVEIDLEEASESIYVNTASKNRLATSFSDAQHIDLDIRMLRNYSQVDYARRIGSRGENFAALIRTICQDSELRDAFLSWLRGLRQEEVDDIGTLLGAIGEPMFMLRENGIEFPAPVLSDGTLRFAAITAAFFQPDMPDIITIEEIESGIHASRVQLLLELLRSQARFAKTQIVATTHSGTILDWLQEEDYETTFLCTRDESTGESRMSPLTEVPHFMEAVKKRSISELFSEGWMEMAS